MSHLDSVFNHFRPTSGEVLRHHCIHVSSTSLLQFTSDLPFDGVPRSRSRAWFVFGSFSLKKTIYDLRLFALVKLQINLKEEYFCLIIKNF
jgi:hypothetical protein